VALAVSGPLDGERRASDGALRFVAAVTATVLSGWVLLTSGVGALFFATACAAGGLIYLLARPDAAVGVFTFLLYTNAPVIADRYHGVPTGIAAAYPLLLLIPIAHQILQRGRAIHLGPVSPFLFVYGAVQLVGAVLSVEPETSLDFFVTYLLEACVLYVLVTNAIRTPEALGHAITGLLAAGAFIGAIVCWQQSTGSFGDDFGGFGQVDAGQGFATSTLEGASRQRRLSGPIGEPNRYAQIMVMLVPLAMFRYRASRTLSGKLACAGALGLVLVASSFAFSRGSALALGLLLAALVIRGHIPVRRAAIAGAAAAALVLVTAPQYMMRLSSLGALGGAVTNRDDPGIQNADSSVQGRATEMIAAALMFADHPLIGVGPKMYPQHYIEYARIAGGRARAEERQPHNLMLQVAAESGVIGLAAMTAIFWVTFRTLGAARRRWQYLRPDLVHLSDGLAMCLFVYLATSVFLHASYIRYFWVVLSIAAATGAVLAPEERSTLAPILRAIRARAR
jgi:hypothetical protein